MRKLRTAISGTLCIFATACVMNLTPSTPTVGSSSSSEFTPSNAPSNQAQQNSPVFTDSTQPNLIVNVSPSPIVSSSPLISPTFTPSPEPTWPPDVVAKNLSFVDWPEYPGVQFFRGEGSGIYFPYAFYRAYIGGLEVLQRSIFEYPVATGDLVVQMGDIESSPIMNGSLDDRYLGWGDMKLDGILSGNETWTLIKCSSMNPSRIDGTRPRQSCSSNGQEHFTRTYNGDDSILSNEYEYDKDNKIIWLEPGFIPGSTEPVKLSLEDLDNPVLVKSTLDIYVDNLGKTYQSSYIGTDEKDMFTRALTCGKKALYLVLPNAQKRTLTMYAFLLPNLDRVVEFDVPFVDKSGFWVRYYNGKGTTDYPRDSIVLRYHPATQKLYLFIENIDGWSDDAYEALVQPILHFLPSGFFRPQLFRFSEEYILQ